MKSRSNIKTIKSFFAFAALVACAVVLSPAVGRAQSGNTIFGCYNKTNGNLRRVNSPADCKNPEIPISWNIQGPQGPQGPKGDPGTPGTPGPSGVLDNGTATDTYGDIAPGQCVFNSRFTTAAAGKITVIAPTSTSPVGLVWVGIATDTFDPGFGTPPSNEARWKVCNITSSTIPNQSLTNLWAVLGP